MPELQCIVVTPETTVCQTPADFVALALYDGELGIAPGHSPLIGRLGYGELRITRGNETKRYYIEGGFVEVIADAVSVLTNRAIPVENLDAEAAREQLAAVEAKPAHSPELMAMRDRVAAQSRAQIRLAQRGND